MSLLGIDAAGHSMFLYLKRIQDILEQTQISANERKGGAWTTGMCVVGKDMELAIVIVRNIMSNSTLDTADDVRKLAAEVDVNAMRYNGADTEGYVAGSMKWIAQQMRDMLDKS